MADSSEVLDAPSHEGDHQSTDESCGEAVCSAEVSGCDGNYSHWSERPGLDLDNDTYYKVPGSYLNRMYRLGVDNFNEAAIKNTTRTDVLFTYSEAFWNGYGCAMASVRDCVRGHAIDPKVQ